VPIRPYTTEPRGCHQDHHGTTAVQTYISTLYINTDPIRPNHAVATILFNLPAAAQSRGRAAGGRRRRAAALTSSPMFALCGVWRVADKVYMGE
jgi:hypothetical protein